MSPDFFINNRTRLYEKLQGGALAMTAYSEMQRSTYIAHEFVQEASFWYLTGIEQPDWWLLADGTRGKAWLVRPDADPAKTQFDASLSDEQATAVSGISQIISRDDALRELRQLARQHAVIHTCAQPERIERYGFVPNPAPGAMNESLGRTFKTVLSCHKELAEMRAIKQPAEIAVIKKAIAATKRGFDAARVMLTSAKYEYEIEAAMSYQMRSSGATGNAYQPIVASASSATTMHYCANSSPIKKNNLLLIDVGARYGNYNADISRTYSIGTPSKRRLQVLAALADAHQAIISLCKAGTPIAHYTEAADTIIKKVCVELGLMKTTDVESFRDFLPHLVSHGLGIDVHERFASDQTFQPGMVITVEPGIYIRQEGIGVRVEDDILIGDTKPINLSKTIHY